VLDDRDSFPDSGKRFFFNPQRADQLCGPLSLVVKWYREFFPMEQSDKGVNTAAPLYPATRTRMTQLYLRSPIRLDGIVLDGLSAGTILGLYYSCRHFNSNN
jgi:hypothetical protein